MFETGPFQTCPRCKAVEKSFGILSVDCDTLVRRCKLCRYSHSELLPSLDKKVVYLDQFAISNIYKIKKNIPLGNASNKMFWESCERLTNLAYLRQEVIFPASNLHSDETIVWHSAGDLRLAHEMLSGDTSFVRTDQIAMKQELAFAEAFCRSSAPPRLSFAVDDILDGDRNAWLPTLHIDVNADHSMFADAIRASRQTAATSLQALADRWAKQGPTFDDILQHELASYGSASVQALTEASVKFQKAMMSDDPMALINAQSIIFDRFRALRRFFEKQGTPTERSDAAVLSFWNWGGNCQMPTHRIMAYLFAALGWKISCGQRKPMTGGILNDFSAIATYGPYVDAMFVDRECAELLKHPRLRSDLELKAKIFSLQSRDAFLEYLTNLANGASDAVRAYSKGLYGL
jgi:hypothetical protein